MEKFISNNINIILLVFLSIVYMPLGVRTMKVSNSNEGEVLIIIESFSWTEGLFLLVAATVTRNIRPEIEWLV